MQRVTFCKAFHSILRCKPLPNGLQMATKRHYRCVYRAKEPIKTDENIRKLTHFDDTAQLHTQKSSHLSQGVRTNQFKNQQKSLCRKSSCLLLEVLLSSSRDAVRRNWRVNRCSDGVLVHLHEWATVAVELHVAELAVHVALVENVAVLRGVLVAVAALIDYYYRCVVACCMNVVLSETCCRTCHHHGCDHHSKYCSLHNFVPFFYHYELNIRCFFFLGAKLQHFHGFAKVICLIAKGVSLKRSRETEYSHFVFCRDAHIRAPHTAFAHTRYNNSIFCSNQIYCIFTSKHLDVSLEMCIFTSV